MKDYVIIAICGGSASGKSFISQELYKRNSKDIILISQDDYYKSFEELTIKEKKLINYDHPNAFDVDLLIKDLINLKNGDSIDYPIYSFQQYKRIGTKQIEPKSIILLEGMLVLHYPEIRNIIDKSIYIDCPEKIRFKRMLKRDVRERGKTLEVLNEQYNRYVRPMHEKFVEPQKQYANIIIDGSKAQNVVYKSVENFLEKSNILK